MHTLPIHGRIHCTECFQTACVEFDSSEVTRGDWRIRANPMAWGNPRPQIVVLGFSKGPTQAGALTATHHDDIAYKGSRSNVAKILSHIGVLDVPAGSDPAQQVSAAIADPTGPFHFGSLIRCTVQRFDHKDREWKGSGGGMLDKFVGTEFGSQVASNCVRKHLSELPPETRLIVMFGMGQNLGYVKSAFALFKSIRGGEWQWLNDVAYTDGQITVVHVEHFASQGRLLPDWLNPTSVRGRLGNLAREAVSLALKGTSIRPVTAARAAPIATPTNNPNKDKSPDRTEHISQILGRPIDDLDPTVRTMLALRSANIATIDALVRHTERDLLKLPNFNRRVLRDINEALASNGLTLRTNAPQVTKTTDSIDPSLDSPIDELQLTVKTYIALRDAGVTTIGELIGYTERDLLKIPNLGRRSLNEIKEILHIKGIALSVEGLR